MTQEDWGGMDWLAEDASHPSVGLSLARMTVLPAATSPAHRHDNANEVIHVLSGKIAQRIGQMWVEASTGDTLHVPRNAIHQTRCLSETEAILMVAYSAGARNYEGLDG